MFIVDDWILSKKTALLIANDDDELSYEARKLALIDHCQKNRIKNERTFFGFSVFFLVRSDFRFFCYIKTTVNSIILK